MNGINEYGLDSPPIGELQRFQYENIFITEALPLRRTSSRNSTPAHYLSFIEPDLSEGLISAQNYSKMKKLASCFSTNVTSFFGFESRLGSPEACADFLFAVSSQGGEREALFHFLHDDPQSQQLLQHKEWEHLRDFAATWANPASELFTNVLGLWLEFDTAQAPLEALVPCVFIHTIPLQISSREEERSCDWVFHTAVPLLLGHPLSSSLHERLLEAFRKLPEGASVMDIGFMLSRATNGVRLVFKHLHPSSIIPYLKSLGWSDTEKKLASIIRELQQQVTRVVLHITITEKGVDPSIGLECSYAPDQYHLETRWSSFFEYLTTKGYCCKEKKTEVLKFLGVNNHDSPHQFALSSYAPAVRSSMKTSARALVRYISHVKLCCSPGNPPEAKVYPGVRLFAHQPDGGTLDVQ